jgi:hypothetical protein
MADALSNVAMDLPHLEEEEMATTYPHTTRWQWVQQLLGNDRTHWVDVLVQSMARLDVTEAP